MNSNPSSQSTLLHVRTHRSSSNITKLSSIAQLPERSSIGHRTYRSGEFEEVTNERQRFWAGDTELLKCVEVLRQVAAIVGMTLINRCFNVAASEGVSPGDVR